MSRLDELFAKITGGRTPAPAGPVEWLIVGLGNPGPKYEGTRHNMGFAAADRLAREMNVRVERLRFQSLCGDGVLGGRRVLLMKPNTYMNLSGQAVSEAMAFYKLPADRVLVLCDDVTLPVGRQRIRLQGSDGGHNGLKDIIRCAGQDFPRVRLGVGQKPHPDYDLADWVLGKFTPEDQKLVAQQLDQLPQLCTLLLEGKTQEAMSRYN